MNSSTVKANEKRLLHKITRLAGSVRPLDRTFIEKAQHHLSGLTKPPNSLGRLEEMACQYIAITKNLNPRIEKKVIVVFAADHGVALEGVSAYPQAVTAQMVLNFINGGAAINALAKHVGVQVQVVDIGVAHAFDRIRGLTDRKVGLGTRNMISGPAMTLKETQKAIGVGIDLANEAANEGVHIIGTGEMGIGNTTASSALLSVMIGDEIESVTGFGTGLTPAQRQHKMEVIKRAIETNQHLLTDPISILSAVGGLEIAGICGLIIGCAANRLPAIVDGFISSVAALVAIKINPVIKEYLFFAHNSREQGHERLLTHIGVKPILDLRLCLGEGTGAVLAMNLIEAALKIYSDMATFEGAGISRKCEP
ncbi:nicotinate-nucleotide--dimethylbenzimidazole phosphoribosyltransferase [bacterium]|nr:nicotinate-nucleotide--dimethylbenzimidazole phosphoribosyltransferase [bacterium]